MKKFLAITAAAAAMSIAFATPVDATMFQKVEPYAGQENFPIDGFCGLEEVQFNVEFSGRVHIREGKGKQAGAFFLHDNYSVLETITNRQNGKSFTVSRDGVTQDISRHPGRWIHLRVRHSRSRPAIRRSGHGRQRRAPGPWGDHHHVSIRHVGR